jgi:hypothetical protein
MSALSFLTFDLSAGNILFFSSLPLPGATLHNRYQNPALTRLVCFYTCLAHASMAHIQA